jgi:hypothetical protein
MIKKPANTLSVKASDEAVKEQQGQSIVRRDTDNVNDIRISFYDIDYALMWHLENIVKPTITEGDEVVTVPFMFASAEKWAAVKKYGFVRDNQGKIQTPMISIRRAGVTTREDMRRMAVSEAAENRIILEKKYSAQNRYDAFSLMYNKRPNKEFYAMSLPKFVEVQYDLVIWTNYTFQMNEVIEQLMWWDGKAFGDTNKFTTKIDDPSFEQTNIPGEDRIVKSTIPVRVKAYILNPTGPNAPALNKLVGVNKIVSMTEVDLTADEYIQNSRSKPPGYQQDLSNS